MALRRSHPKPPPSGAPIVCRWDLDKTYLKSEWETLREMVRIPFEKAEDKVAAPGVAALMRGLRETALSRGQIIRVYFVSASPPQIGRAIRRKLELDGIVYDGIIFKNQLQRLMRGSSATCASRWASKSPSCRRAPAEPRAAREYLFGDDWESDPLIYSLYADIVAGRVDAAELGAILRAVRVDAPLIEQACGLAASLEPIDAVSRIFINLERPTPPAHLRVYGGRLVPTFNYLASAACLFAEDALSAAAVVQVARSLLEDSSYTPERLRNSIGDIVRRGHVHTDAAAALREALESAGMLTAPRRPSWIERVRRWRPARRNGAAMIASTTPIALSGACASRRREAA
jgi:hypothetical protein